jgi:hypothetical protein
MEAPQEDIMQGKKQHRRFLDLAYGGPLYTKMVRITTEYAMYAKELGNCP